MGVSWDYTELADSFTRRPGYSQAVVRELLAVTGMHPGMRAADVGAGTGNLSLPLLEAGLKVVAVEPNPAMLRIGRERCCAYSGVNWLQAVGEATALASARFHLATFGSSFNVVDRGLALLETFRILRPRGWFACLWNHRDLQDPLQKAIEGRIRSAVTNYEYGIRRHDPTEFILASGLFGEVRPIESGFSHRTSVADWMEAWRSHATLRRQAGDRFPEVLAGIEELIIERGTPVIEVPYVTRAWIARSLS